MRSLPILVLPLLLGACVHAGPPVDPPREIARSVVLTTAVAVKVADEACAVVVRERQDEALGRSCEEAYRVARSSLLAAGESVDAGGDGQRQGVACGVAKAARALARVGELLRERGVDLPPVAVDALKLAPAVVGGCHG